MEILKSALDTYFYGLFNKINTICWDINENYLKKETVDEAVNIQNNLHVYEQNLKEIKTTMDLALLSISNLEKKLKKIENHIHSG